MFRSLFRRPRTIRVPIDRSNVEVQQVKVTKHSRPLVARFILTFAVTSIVIQGMKRWDPLGTYAQRDVIQEELERVKKDGQGAQEERYGKHWDKQHSRIQGLQGTTESPTTEKSDALRITVPVWLRTGHQRLYTENDPEWKEYVKLQSDPKRLDQIKRQIGESVMHQVSDHGRNKFELGIIKFNGRVGVALEIVPQVYTPPIYEIPCIWLSPRAITTGWRSLPSQTGARMERVFKPVVLLEASTAAMKTFFYMTYAVTKARLNEALGRDTPGQKSTIYVPKLPPQSDDISETINTEDSKSEKPFFPAFPDLSDGDAMRKMHADVVSSMPYSSAIQHAAFAFNYVRATRQRLAVSTNVKGVCQVRGFITFFGDRGRFRLEVIAYYLPADNVFVGAVNVRTGYVVQDYRAWEKLNEKERKQKLIKEADSDSPPPPADTKPVEPSSTATTGQDKEENK